MTTEQIQGLLSSDRDFNQQSNFMDHYRALWEIALQLSILNSRSQPQPSKDSAGERSLAKLYKIEACVERWKANKAQSDDSLWTIRAILKADE